MKAIIAKLNVVLALLSPMPCQTSAVRAAGGVGGTFAPSLFVLIYSPCYLIKEKERRYIITPGKIYYFYGNASNMSLDISLIKDIKLHRSFIKSSTGTIKPKLKHGGNFGYAIIAADGAQEIYDLLKRLAEL